MNMFVVLMCVCFMNMIVVLMCECYMNTMVVLICIWFGWPRCRFCFRGGSYSKTGLFGLLFNLKSHK